MSTNGAENSERTLEIGCTTNLELKNLLQEAKRDQRESRYQMYSKYRCCNFRKNHSADSNKPRRTESRFKLA